MKKILTKIKKGNVKDREFEVQDFCYFEDDNGYQKCGNPHKIKESDIIKNIINDTNKNDTYGIFNITTRSMVYTTIDNRFNGDTSKDVHSVVTDKNLIPVSIDNQLLSIIYKDKDYILALPTYR